MNDKQRQCINLLEEYWSKNSHLGFGAILDDILAIHGSKLDLYYCSTDNFIDWLSEELEEEQIFTSNTLNELKAKRMKEYSENPEMFTEEPKSLFIDGEFSLLNYFGGDDIIRPFFDYTHNEEMVDIDYQVHANGAVKMATLSAYCFYHEYEDKYVFTVTSKRPNESSVSHLGYFFEVNSFDNISSATVNGREVDENDYLLLLNIIKESGFSFKEGCYPSKFDEY